jgi:hypothetical protein
MSVPAIISTKSVKKAAANTAGYAKNNPQTLLILAAIGLGLYAVWQIKKGIDKAGEIGGGILNPGSGSPGGQTTTNGSGGAQPSITPNQASALARVLLNAMDGFGTDTEEIYNALRGKNPADYHLISEAFGTPRYDGAGEGIWPAPERNLTDWLTRELDSSEMNQLRKIIPGVF